MTALSTFVAAMLLVLRAQGDSIQCSNDYGDDPSATPKLTATYACKEGELTFTEVSATTYTATVADFGPGCNLTFAMNPRIPRRITYKITDGDDDEFKILTLLGAQDETLKTKKDIALYSADMAFERYHKWSSSSYAEFSTERLTLELTIGEEEASCYQRIDVSASGSVDIPNPTGSERYHSCLIYLRSADASNPTFDISFTYTAKRPTASCRYGQVNLAPDYDVNPLMRGADWLCVRDLPDKTFKYPTTNHLGILVLRREDYFNDVVIQYALS